MRRNLISWILSLLPVWAGASFVIQDTVKLDRTLEPLPLVVRPGTSFKATSLTDNSFLRPALVAIDANVRIGTCVRKPTGQQVRDTDPPLAKWFDGAFLPDITGLTFSHHDFARAMIVLMGDCTLKVDSLTSDLGVLVLPRPDGTYGKTTVIDIGYGKGRSIVFASGQENLVCRITSAMQLGYSYQDAEVGGGHCFYANESRFNGKYLRLVRPYVRIGKARGSAAEPGLRVNASPTAKFKGSWWIDYECLDDQNPFGALDSFQSCGIARFRWTYPRGLTCQSSAFTGFRIGDRSGFGNPPGIMGVFATLDGSCQPDRSVPVLRVNTLDDRPVSLGVSIAEGDKADVYGVAAQLFKIGTAVEIPK